MGFETFHKRITAIMRSGSPSAIADAEHEARRAIDEEEWTPSDLGLALGVRGELLSMQARYIDAARLLRQALPMLEAPLDKHQVAVGWAFAINANQDHADAPAVAAALRSALAADEVQTSPKRAWGLAWLARLTCGESPSDALALAREAVCLSTATSLGRPEAKLALGYALRQVGKYDEAIVTFEEVVAMASGYCRSEAQTTLADLYDAIGEDDQTDRVLANAVEDVPVEFTEQYHRVLRIIYKVLKKRPERGTQMLGRLLLRMDDNIQQARKEEVHA